jgi:hypothetical protein
MLAHYAAYILAYYVVSFLAFCVGRSLANSVDIGFADSNDCAWPPPDICFLYVFSARRRFAFLVPPFVAGNTAG